MFSSRRRNLEKEFAIESRASKQILVATGVGKRYKIYEKPIHRLIEGLPGQKKWSKDFWALKNIDFQLERGKTLGLLGRNGSGKSTLLQLICGITSPSKGSTKVYGRIGALLELGSGFNPEFTGIENVFLNASVLGMSRAETERCLARILEFADIGEFAYQPVKLYSSGMSIRLAFAIQAMIEPELLIVDEALAVGDELFQKKCYNHIRYLKRKGTSILLVTHNCQQIIQHCDVALLLDSGEKLMWGSPRDVTNTYQRLMSSSPEENWKNAIHNITQGSEENKSYNSKPSRNTLFNENVEHQHRPTSHNDVPNRVHYQERGGRIVNVSIRNELDVTQARINEDEDFTVCFEYEVYESFESLQFGCHLADTSGLRITGQGYPGGASDGIYMEKGARFKVDYRFKAGLNPGTYYVGGGFWKENEPGFYIHRVVDYLRLEIIANGPATSMGLCNLTRGSAILRMSEVN